jgi:hypothetical protein
MSRYVLARRFGVPIQGVGAEGSSIAIGGKTMFVVGMFVGAATVYGGIALFGVQGIKDKISNLNKKYQTHTAGN